MFHVPINAVTWSLGAISLYTFGVKSWLTYRRTNNPLAQIYYILGLTFGTALFFFGVPGLFTQNVHLLRYTYFAADFFVQVSMQIQVWLLWFLGLRNHFRLQQLLVCSIPYSVILITAEVLTSQVTLSHSPNLIVYTDKPLVLALKSIIYIMVAIPLGYFFLRQVPGQTTIRAKLKSLTAGLTFIVVSLAATSNNIFDKGSDTAQSSIIVAVFFVILFLAQLPRPSASQSNH